MGQYERSQNTEFGYTFTGIDEDKIGATDMIETTTIEVKNRVVDGTSYYPFKQYRSTHAYTLETALINPAVSRIDYKSAHTVIGGIDCHHVEFLISYWTIVGVKFGGRTYICDYDSHTTKCHIKQWAGWGDSEIVTIESLDNLFLTGDIDAFHADRFRYVINVSIPGYLPMDSGVCGTMWGLRDAMIAQKNNSRDHGYIVTGNWEIGYECRQAGNNYVDHIITWDIITMPDMFHYFSPDEFSEEFGTSYFNDLFTTV